MHHKTRAHQPTRPCYPPFLLPPPPHMLPAPLCRRQITSKIWIWIVGIISVIRIIYCFPNGPGTGERAEAGEGGGRKRRERGDGGGGDIAIVSLAHNREAIASRLNRSGWRRRKRLQRKHRTKLANFGGRLSVPLLSCPSSCVSSALDSMAGLVPSIILEEYSLLVALALHSLWMVESVLMTRSPFSLSLSLARTHPPSFSLLLPVKA